MEIKSTLPWQVFLVASALLFGALATFGEPQQVSQPAITQVEVDRTGQKTLVRVMGSHALACRTMHLSDPERLVLDFPGARLVGLRPSIRAAFPPILRVRSGQFRPDVARVVIDLERIVAYRVRSEEKSVTVEFDVEAFTPAHSAPIAAPSDRALHVAVARPPGASPSAQRPVAGNDSTPRPDSSADPPPPAASGPSSDSEIAPLDSFENGMLTLNAKNQSLRRVLRRISHLAGVSIYLAEGLSKGMADCPVSVEFQHYRLDEALRQILRNYDVFFLYGEGQGTLGSPPLRGVWVYPAGQVAAGRRWPESSAITRKQGTPMQTAAHTKP